MNKKTKPVFYMLVISGLLLLAVLIMQPVQLYLFGTSIPMIFPSGWVALEERNLLFFIQALMLIVMIPVFIFTFIFSWHYPDLVDHKLAEVVWWGVPFLLVVIISIVTYYKTHELDPYKPLQSNEKPLTVQVVALQWKWLFIYPEEGIATINTLVIPEKRPIRFLITSDAPMNSFWIPDLGGQIYAMPGMQTELNLVANEPGEFRGSSANISGEGFADMYFITKAESQSDFDNWVKSAQNSPKQLDLKAYKELAAPSRNNTVTLYRLQDEALFKQVVMKYMSIR
jgi:cytochrome o ubiquinol oxidase subunit 2